jgi:hypothetical protein
MSLSEQRRFVSPLPGDDWNAIAARALPGVPTAEAFARLRSWNLHLFARIPPGQILGSDVVFVEPPRNQDGRVVG